MIDETRRSERGSAERLIRLVPIPVLGDSAYSYANNVRNGRVLNESLPFRTTPQYQCRTLALVPASPSIHLPLFSFLSTPSISLSLSGSLHVKKEMKLIRTENIRLCIVVFSRQHFTLEKVICDYNCMIK